MQALQRRCLILAGVFALGVALTAATEAATAPASAARWPTDDALYAVPDWTLAPAVVEAQHGVHLVQRRYTRAGGRSVTLALTTGAEAKRIYRADAAVPFLGSGYTVDHPPPNLVPPASGRQAVLVRREGAQALLLYAYGERRGQLGNGAPAWTLVGADALLGRANDYYLASVLVPLDRLDSPAAHEAVELADTLLSRLAAWYASPSPPVAP